MAITTDRLVLRDWRESDFVPWAAMNADPEVMEFLGPLATPEQARESMERCQTKIEGFGFGPWALEIRGSGEFIGFTGLNVIGEGMPFAGVEVGWRLARSAWGHGYATEAALASLAYGFDTVGLDDVVAFTATTNLRSQAVMHRVGMTRDPVGDFDHPGVPPDSSLRPHVLFRKARPLRSS